MAIRFRKHRIADETFEAAGVWDVDGDGVPDIVSGGFWYQGPDFRKKHLLGVPPREAEYYDDFSTLALDLDGTGRPGYVTGGWWGGHLRFRACPADPRQPWTDRIVAPTSNIETTRMWDIDGDGKPEIFPNCPGSRTVDIFKPVYGDGARPGTLEKVTVFVFPEGRVQGHGFGAGDLAGHGRTDIVLSAGWLEQPADWRRPWTWHPGPDLGCASDPILVADVDEDGQNELIAGQAHGYGLDWYKRAADGGAWVRHPIDPENAQYHDLQWADIDGDGRRELVTGKRHRAHNGREPGEWDDYGIYYFKWTGEGFSKQIVDWGRYGEGAQGTGIAFALADLRGTGRLDIVAPGKDGLTVYYNEGPAPLGR